MHSDKSNRRTLDLQEATFDGSLFNMMVLIWYQKIELHITGQNKEAKQKQNQAVQD